MASKTFKSTGFYMTAKENKLKHKQIMSAQVLKRTDWKDQLKPKNENSYGIKHTFYSVKKKVKAIVGDQPTQRLTYTNARMEDLQDKIHKKVFPHVVEISGSEWFTDEQKTKINQFLVDNYNKDDYRSSFFVNQGVRYRIYLIRFRKEEDKNLFLLHWSDYVLK